METRTMTPMLIQYMEIKNKVPDALLFYRMGDFYEMFFDDAIKAAPVLDVQLTSRDKNAENPIPMCGVPFHAANNYIQKLIQAGFKVALCEQMEQASATKGLVKREVVRIVTPSLIGDPDMVNEENRNYLFSIKETSNQLYDVAILELLGGNLKHDILTSEKELIDIFLEHNPKEILVEEGTVPWVETLKTLSSHLVISIRKPFFDQNDSLVAIQFYLKETQKTDTLDFLKKPEPILKQRLFKLDSTTLKSLEVLEGSSIDGPCLFKILNHTCTAMGRRTLKDWLAHPLSTLKPIKKRHEAVSELLNQTELSNNLKKTLSQIRDLERLSTKTSLGLSQPRDLVAIREILKIIPILKEALKSNHSPLLQDINNRLDPLKSLCTQLEDALLDEPPSTIRDGGIFKESYLPEILELRTLSTRAKETLAQMENREKTQTGISTLKIKYSRVFGYTIEITNSHLSKVPSHYIRKQTIANGERFITEELKNFEEKILSADLKLKNLEETLFLQLRLEVAKHTPYLFQNSNTLGELDCLLSFALVARQNKYCQPEMTSDWDLWIEEGRHPVIETLLPPGQFVANSVHFSEEECRTLLITGPNMAGKSTIMRQIALIVLMAHAGSFVPAHKASIPLSDAIFTRIGSSDDLAQGKSTFMVEMSEVTRILNQATSRSLILIDEIGRGTSTYDGLSLAWSLLEYIHGIIAAKTLFATHFHEITTLEKTLPALVNANVQVNDWNGEMVFLHKLVLGICNQSYGIEVAKLAGIPNSVLKRAKDILNRLESQSGKPSEKKYAALHLPTEQMLLFDGQKPLGKPVILDS